MARVLRMGGQVGVSDLTRYGALPAELSDLLSWVSCIADAQPLSEYVALLAAANLKTLTTEEHNSALIDFVNKIRTRLLISEAMIGLNKLTLPGFNIEVVKEFAGHGLNAIRTGKLGYAIVIAAKAG